MITVKDIKRRYGEPIKRDFIADINKYIDTPEVQSIIQRACVYTLTEANRDWLWENGQHTGKYQHLNYLCTIYIHPLTAAQNILRKAEALCKN